MIFSRNSLSLVVPVYMDGEPEASEALKDRDDEAFKKDWKHCEEKYGKRLLLRCIHHFKSDLINNMGHMRISGTEPSSVTLIQTK